VGVVVAVNAVVKPPPRSTRNLRESDLPAVLAIERAAYEFPWSEGVFRDCLKAGYGALVLEVDGRVIGYGLVACAAGEAHVLNVAVDPHHQGAGHGRHLVRRLVDLARWYRAERVFLEVRPSNTRAIRLYHQLGFNEIGQRPNYYPARQGREDALVMALELLPPQAEEHGRPRPR
jgi:ribosomal-protein-alanine N-acetyltransferase